MGVIVAPIWPQQILNDGSHTQLRSHRVCVHWQDSHAGPRRRHGGEIRYEREHLPRPEAGLAVWLRVIVLVAVAVHV